MVMMSFLKSLFSVRNDAGQFGSDLEVVEWGKPYEASAGDGVFEVAALPAELLLYILSWVPAVDLVKICSQVCKQWCEISRSASLWKIKCVRERKYMPHLMGPPPEDFMKFYFLSPYTRNLLRNDRALEGFNYWRRTNEHHLTVEDSPTGSKPIQNCMEINGPVKNWVTSYVISSIEQVVSLLEEGCAIKLLDEVRPDIYISVWCAARWDCGSIFFFTAQLLNDQKNVLTEFNEEKNLSYSREDWHKVEHTFRDYPPGIRYVKIKMAGVDTQFWAGHYGSKFTLPCVKFVFQKKSEQLKSKKSVTNTAKKAKECVYPRGGEHKEC